ncbi:MAG TPA: hypothetical protein V6D22_02655 [Candidatus Obscuribacterales bacterium]
MGKPILRGGLVDEASPMWIIQRKEQTDPFALELNKRMPMLPPPVSKALQAKMDSVPFLRGGVDDADFSFPKRQPELSPGFRLEVSRINRPPVPPTMFLWPAFDPVRQPVPGTLLPSLAPDEANRISREMDRQVFSGRRSDGDFDLHGRLYRPNNASAEIDGELRRESGASSDIYGQLRKVSNPQVRPDVSAEMADQQARAKRMSDKQAETVSSELTAVFRRIPNAPADLEVSGKLLAPDSEDGISWDAWYKGIARLSEPLLGAFVERSGGPSGSNTVSITVLSDHHLSVSLVSGGNKIFDVAIMRAYRQLDGNRALAFPSGSHRTRVTFLADNKHDAAGAVSDVSTQTCVGDTEPLLLRDRDKAVLRKSTVQRRSLTAAKATKVSRTKSKPRKKTI